ncbi:efflux RND transporter periplasmic adaptor subunit [Sphingobacterium sp. DR205]|uniref:efflux RND transporter periplasmic adaptor subunit n=1 Tax=Sphingobacterium sp. DR205 TaxID=2713573 RepID=UPI0013E4790B|nr:efflux RND transporter periplasmic adaptor subunit [Sphingobacterium sp. DR205]QIH33336.1 efflux RND transporter periplasmic adaptor subunit [Sphingobacterium sp. DR205]
MKQNVVKKRTTNLFIALVLLSSCTGKRQGDGYQQGPAEVLFDTVTTGDATIRNEYASAIEGLSNIEIRPQVNGYLQKIFVDEGDYVRAGQTLFKIEDRIFREQLTNAKAALAVAESNLLTAKIELDRKTELTKSRIVSDIQMQEAQASYAAANASVAQARSAIASAQINLDFSVIKSPVNGYIGRFNYRLGSLLSTTNQEAITVVSDNHQVYAYFSLSERDFVRFQREHTGSTVAEKLQNAAPVALLLSDGQEYATKGRIDAVEGQFNKNTGSITFRAKFDNPNAALRSGNTGKIVMVQQLKEMPLLPIASTVTYQDKVFAYTVDKENKVVQIPVTISGKSEDNFIIREGLKQGDRYIAQGFERLQPGMPVTAQKQTQNKK